MRGVDGDDSGVSWAAARQSIAGLGVGLALEQPSPQALRRFEDEYSLAVEPLSNMVASGQIHRADRIRATHREGSRFLKFIRIPNLTAKAYVYRRAAVHPPRRRFGTSETD